MVDEHSMLHVAIQNLVVEVRNTNEKVDTLSKEMGLLIANQVEIRELKESVTRAFKRLETIENERNNGMGCPSFRATKKVVDDLELESKAQKEKPIKMIDKFVLSIIAVCGASVGGWILLKFGVQTK